MKSVRRERQQHARVLDDALQVLELEQAKRDAIKAALIEAKNANSEEPRKCIETKGIALYLPAQIYTATEVRCDECGDTSLTRNIGEHRWCPSCGSRLTEIARESSPGDLAASDRAKRIYAVGMADQVRK